MLRLWYTSENINGDLNGRVKNAFSQVHERFKPNLFLQNFLAVNLLPLNGLTVRQFLGQANSCLGGGVCNFSINDVDLVTSELNRSFESGTPSLFAQNNLAVPTHVHLKCPR